MICLILDSHIFTSVCRDSKSWHDFLWDLLFIFAYLSTHSFYPLILSCQWSSYNWSFPSILGNKLVIFVIIHMSSSIIVVPFASRALFEFMYLVLFRLGIFDVLSLVNSLLLDTFIEKDVRERTGPVFAGGGLGGIFEWNYCISYIFAKVLSIPITFFLLLFFFFHLLLHFFFLLLLTNLFLLLTFCFSFFVFVSLFQSTYFTIFDCICLKLHN